MLIEEKSLRHWINNFYGFGSWEASMWFIALEESGGDTPEDVAERLNYFYHEHSSSPDAALCDIRDMYRHVKMRQDRSKAKQFTTLYDFRFSDKAVSHGVWKNLIAFEHGFRHKDVQDTLEYQKHAFASTSARNEALIRLFPLPSPHNHAWYYSWLDLPQMPYLKRRELFQEHVYQMRMQTILERISLHKPEMVMMYGMENINTLKSSVQGFFANVNFKLVKAVKRQIPQHHRADLHGTILIITTQIPALRHNRIETGFDWELFGNTVGLSDNR